MTAHTIADWIGWPLALLGAWTVWTSLADVPPFRRRYRVREGIYGWDVQVRLWFWPSWITIYDPRVLSEKRALEAARIYAHPITIDTP